MKYNLKRNKPYELVLTIDLDKTDLDLYLEEARKRLANELKLDGFRQGKVPAEIAKDKLDQNQVLETAFNLAFRQSFADVLSKEKLEVIETGDFKVKDNSSEKLVYSVSLIVFPECKLKDYKNIKVAKKETGVSEGEVEAVLESIRKSRAASGAVPELNDEFAKSLGRFDNVAELKANVSEGLKEEKNMKESQRVQAAVLDKIAEGTRIDPPPVLVIRQLDQMILDLDSDLHRQGMELNLFLAKIKKTEVELREEWKKKAELLVRKALILKEIARLEKIEVGEEEVKGRVNDFLGNFPNLAEAEKKIDLVKLADQIRQILLNQKVLVFLEREAL
mgnify:FL=1